MIKLWRRTKGEQLDATLGHLLGKRGAKGVIKLYEEILGELGDYYYLGTSIGVVSFNKKTAQSIASENLAQKVENTRFANSIHSQKTLPKPILTERTMAGVGQIYNFSLDATVQELRHPYSSGMTAGEMTSGEMMSTEKASTEMASGEMMSTEMTFTEMTSGEMMSTEMASTEMASGEMTSTHGMGSEPMAMEHHAIHGDNPIKQAEHMALLDLLPSGAETFKAVNSGSWFDVSTWEGHSIPGDGAKVLIPQGVSVIYDRESDARLDIVRINGSLSFSHDRNTKMVVDTLISDTTGVLTIGTAENPIEADKTAQIIIDSQTAVDDLLQLGKGVITHGTTRIYGAEKLDFVSLQNAQAGDNELILNLPEGSAVPQGWQVGDRLVLAGTAYNYQGSDADNTRFQDEVLTITAINGTRISFINQDIPTGDNTVLRFNHTRPAGFEDHVNLYVANITRNVIFATENGADVPTMNRGHVMFMHNPDIQVINAGFYDLGRSDKNRVVDDVGINRDGTEGNGTNVRGRYALHFHRTGAEDGSGIPALAKGNAVVGSPGWGIVHHDSYAVLEDNVVFDVVGAGIVAEAGNEIGSWHNNITIKTTGDENPDHSFQHGGDRVQRFDMGFNGEGYWVQGAGQVVMTDNVAISANSAGITIFGGGDGGAEAREKHTISVANLPAAWQDIAQGQGDGSSVDVATTPLRQLSGFETYNAEKGILTWGTMLNSDGQLTMNVPGAHLVDTVIPAHNYRATVEDFQLWNIRQNGVQLWYTTQYDLSNGLILADTSIHPNGRGAGIANNGKNHSFSKLQIEDFAIGIQLPNDGAYTFGSRHRAWGSSVIEDSSITGVRSNFSYFHDDGHFLRLLGNNQFGPAAGNGLPVASFTVEAVGGLAYRFDASGSYDVDPWSTESRYETQGIIAYGWDFDGDGGIDQFGRTASYKFMHSGPQTVYLTVWDQQGETTTLDHSLDVQPTAYGNAFSNGDFSQDLFNDYNIGSSDDADLGWSRNSGTFDLLLGQGGAFVLSDGTQNHSGLTQVIEDQQMRSGIHTLSATVKNAEGSQERDFHLNQIMVTLWGINGQFENRVSDLGRGPQPVGALPMEAVELFKTDIGGTSYDWQTFTWDVNLGSGFQYLLAEVHVQNTIQAGDFVAIDNFALTGNGGL